VGSVDDFSTILLIETLRATVEQVRETPALDPAAPGIVEFQRVLETEIARLRKHNESALPVRARTA